MRGRDEGGVEGERGGEVVKTLTRTKCHTC